MLVTGVYVYYKYNNNVGDTNVVQEQSINNSSWSLIKEEIINKTENNKKTIENINNYQTSLTFLDDEAIVCFVEDECVNSKYIHEDNKYIIEPTEGFYFDGIVTIMDEELILTRESDDNYKYIYYFLRLKEN